MGQEIGLLARNIYYKIWVTVVHINGGCYLAAFFEHTLPRPIYSRLFKIGMKNQVENFHWKTLALVFKAKCGKRFFGDQLSMLLYKMTGVFDLQR